MLAEQGRDPHGRNPWQLGAAANHWPVFPPEYASFTEALAAAGVACGASGKFWEPGRASTASGEPRLWGLKAAKRAATPAEAFREFLASRRPGQPFF